MAGVIFGRLDGHTCCSVNDASYCVSDIVL